MPFKGLFGEKPVEEDVDKEDYLNELSIREGRVIESSDITYVKPLELDPEGKNIGSITSELEKNNIVVMNVKSLLHNKVLLREIVKELRDICIDMNGDIARVSDEKILILPGGMRVTPEKE